MTTNMCGRRMEAVVLGLYVAGLLFAAGCGPAGETARVEPAMEPKLSETGSAVVSRAVESSYCGWKTVCLDNGLVELQVLPDIGGRILQFKLGDKEFLWVNPKLAGKLPQANGLAEDGGWFNVGADKLWPAPQGWDNDEQWPGPPDAVLDGQPYTLEKLRGKRGEAAIRLTGHKDQRSGIQFLRVVRVFEGSTRVNFEATMKNIDTRPRRWGIWSHTLAGLQPSTAKAVRCSCSDSSLSWTRSIPMARRWSSG